MFLTYFYHSNLHIRLKDIHGALNHTYPPELNLPRSIACRAGIIWPASAQYFLTKIMAAINNYMLITFAPPNEMPALQAIRSTFDLAMSPL